MTNWNVERHAKTARCCGLLCGFLVAVLATGSRARAAENFEQFLKPLFAKRCVKCHGGEKVKGKINLKEISDAGQFLANPALIKEMIEAIDARDMPPEDEPELAEEDRSRLLASLRAALAEAAGDAKSKSVRIRRLNRFQYNNAVRDLFALNRDVFHLPEKMMTRHSNYLAKADGEMPAQVKVSSLSLQSEGGMANVQAFPKDLRAAHGFDNQANQLTLSPLLLDTFLKLSVSIIESPDFNPETVGIWSEFFADPVGGGDLRAEVRKRLEPFLNRAFRGPVDDATLDRYTGYALSKLQEELSFPDTMKKVASAILSSPRFLYRTGATTEEEDLFVVASNLSFFLWSSGPDQELLRLAASGGLSRPEIFNKTVERMLADPKIERFLDSFPSQWMQLENALAATPDPNKHRLFSIDKSNPASLQMILEPLLLFDAVFIENRPIAELITPSFSYRSEFLREWYTSDLKPPPIDSSKIIAENKVKDEKRRVLQDTIQRTRAEITVLEKPVRERILVQRRNDPGAKKPVDLKPLAAWEFNGDLKDSVGSLDLTAHGKIHHENGMVVLDGKSYLQSPGLPLDLKAKTLEVWCKVHDVNQRGGGVMGIQGPGDFFDTIVLGERKHRHWISGSNGFARTADFPESKPEEKPNERLHLAMVYAEDGTTTLYRNGGPYGKPFRKGRAVFPKGRSSVIFGLRHLPPGGNKHLRVSLGRARLYDRALSAEEVAASSGSDLSYVSQDEFVKAFTPAQHGQWDALAKTLEQTERDLKAVPRNLDPGKARQESQRRFEDQWRKKVRSQDFKRVAASDPRYGGVITNAATLSMTSGPKRTHPIARGAWVIEVIFNDPPPPPPNDVPPLNEDAGDKDLTIREKFAQHRENPDCAGCHSRLDPLGFALENYDVTGRWRDKYENGREIDSSGTLVRKYAFDGAVRFKEALRKEDRRFARAFTAHLLRFALATELSPADALTVDKIVASAAGEDYRLKALIKEVIRSERFLQTN